MVAVFMMYNITFRNRSIMMLPNGDMECNLLAVSIFPPAPKIPSVRLVLSIGGPVVLPPIEHDGLRAWVALVHSASNLFC